MNKSIYPNPRQSLLLLVLFYISYVACFLLIGFLLLKLGSVPQKNFKSVLFAGSSISLIPLIIYFSKKSEIPLKWVVKFPGIKIILLMIFLSVSIRIVSSPFAYFLEYFDNIFNGKLKYFVFGVPEFNLTMAIHAISSVVIAPIIEEYFFRKQILGQLLKRYSPFIAIVFSTLFFAAGHLRLHDLGSLIIWGLFYGIIYYKTKSIETSILLHSFSNLSNFFYKYEFHAITEIKLLAYIIMMLASIAVIYLIIKYIYRNYKFQEDFQKEVTEKFEDLEETNNSYEK